jgi:hypothetical protein
MVFRLSQRTTAPSAQRTIIAPYSLYFSRNASAFWLRKSFRAARRQAWFQSHEARANKRSMMVGVNRARRGVADGEVFGDEGSCGDDFDVGFRLENRAVADPAICAKISTAPARIAGLSDRGATAQVSAPIWWR